MFKEKHISGERQQRNRHQSVFREKHHAVERQRRKGLAPEKQSPIREKQASAKWQQRKDKKEKDQQRKYDNRHTVDIQEAMQ